MDSAPTILAMARPLQRARPPQGAHLANLRKAAGLSQTALAEIIGEPQSTLAKWELSPRPPRSDALPKIATALGVTVEDILRVSDAKPKQRPKSKLAEIVEQVSLLPRRQQERFVQVASIFLEQERRRAG